MRGKLMLLIAGGAAMAIALLVVRQQRLQAVYEMTRALERAAEHDRVLWQVRARIASEIKPDRIRQMAASFAPLNPILRELGAPTAVAEAKKRAVEPE